MSFPTDAKSITEKFGTPAIYAPPFVPKLSPRRGVLPGPDNSATPGTPPYVSAVQYKLSLTGTSDAEQAVMYDLLWKFSRGDWHGVSDAANDLRVLEAERRR